MIIHAQEIEEGRKKERKTKLTIIKSENLPLESSPARIRIPTWSLRVEDGLRECEPLRLVGRRIGKIEFCGTHGGDSPKLKKIKYACMVSSEFLLSLFFFIFFSFIFRIPESLIIISQGFGLIRRHKILIRTDLFLLCACF